MDLCAYNGPAIYLLQTGKKKARINRAFRSVHCCLIKEYDLNLPLPSQPELNLLD